MGHSDADVLTHAVMDALLGAAALGDIGSHFPDTDPAYKGGRQPGAGPPGGGAAGPKRLAGGKHRRNPFVPGAKACAPHPAMRRNLADALGLPPGEVSVKATTEERLGFTGAGLGIAAHAVALLTR